MATPTDHPAAPAPSTELASLVHHTGSVEHDLSLEQVQRAFGEQRVDFLAITRDGMVTGICSRLRLGMLLGTRYGFALYGRSAAQLAQVDHPLVFPVHTPANEVLDAALARPGDEFNEDVVLVDGHGALIGLVPTEALARLQSRLFVAQLAELKRGQQQLLAANEALRQSRGRYAGLFDSHALGVALLDPKATVHAHNQRLAALLNLDDGAAEIASLAPWLVETDRLSFLAELSAQGRTDAAPVAREFSFAVPGRGTRLFRCSLGWIPETAQVCACFDDITEHRAMERRLLRQEKQLLLDTLVGRDCPRAEQQAHAVCYSIVRLHGGEIEVRSEPDAGARFTVTLPAEAAPVDQPFLSAPPASAIVNPAPAGGAAPGAGTRVLVVEDEPHVRRLIQTVLSSRFDCEVDTVANGVEAFERLVAQRYAMVISDIRMATMNGTELYLWLQEAQPLLARRFLFITGYPGETHFAQGVAEWRVPVLAKPFTVAQLCEACTPFLGAGASVLECEPVCA